MTYFGINIYIKDVYHQGTQHFERLATVVSEVVKSELESLIIDENERRLFSLETNAQLCNTFSSLLSIVEVSSW